jgi:hypothetical protein
VSCIKSHINATIVDRNSESSNQNTTTPADNEPTMNIDTNTTTSTRNTTANEAANDTSNRVKDFVNGFMSLTVDQIQFVMHEGFKDLQHYRTTPIEKCQHKQAFKMAQWNGDSHCILVIPIYEGNEKLHYVRHLPT